MNGQQNLIGKKLRMFFSASGKTEEKTINGLVRKDNVNEIVLSDRNISFNDYYFNVLVNEGKTRRYCHPYNDLPYIDFEII